MTSLRRKTSLPRPRQHQRDIVRLFLIANPVVDRAGNQLGDFDKWPPTVLADQFDESLFAELPEVVFRLGNPVAVGYEDLARPELFRSFVERKIVEEPDHHSSRLEPSYRAILPDDDRGQVATVAVGELPRMAVVDAQKQRRILFLRGTGVEVLIQQRKEGTGRNLSPVDSGR